ncbi:ras guanine nucleotide exchange factor domain-containing protein [Phyllosticta citriasiana]|uniref:Ras guanine nucleotide exchange factor domain-containing protein n=1 Tax=Phyllosticta citriasiana TaxID=595635 RepID=A0ABR1KDX8_9PEZI
MNGYSGTLAPPGGMYVRALYDYEADDRTSLSFRQGDIIQVITQLESGWWDGVINGVRGWFPSNYCGRHLATHRRRARRKQRRRRRRGHHRRPAFWIPQATPDGRLFYFNTFDRRQHMELPLETPSSLSENGPRDRTNVNMPEMTRPPPELMGWGLEHQRRRSFTSNGVSPATSMDSIGGGLTRSRSDLHESAQPTGFSGLGPPLGSTMSTYANNSWVGGPMTSAVSRQFFDDAQAVPLTWNRMGRGYAPVRGAFRQAINNSDRSEFVKRAEDLSDHLRSLSSLQRDHVSLFETCLVLLTLLRQTWPPPDSYSKCLKEADGVLNGSMGSSKSQGNNRGEDIPRLISPVSSLASFNGGNWQSNGLSLQDPMNPMSFIDQDDPRRTKHALSRRRNLLTGSMISRDSSFRASGNSRSVWSWDDKVVTPASAAKILEVVSTVDLNPSSLSTLLPIGSTFQNPQVADFSIAKQKVYDMISELILACQANRGDSIEDRLNHVRNVAHDLDSNTAQVRHLQSLPAQRFNSKGFFSTRMPPERWETTPSSKRFFGEVPAPTTPPALKGGTLADSPFNNTFLLTYRSFTTAAELFEMLVKRWSIQPPAGLSREDYQLWVDKKQSPLGSRVTNNEEAQALIQRVYAFAKDPRCDHSLDIDATEFARQLTIIESRLYGKIRPTECLNKTWQKKLSPGEPDPASNVKALILHSNQLTNWVAQMILTQQDVKRRVVVIKHFVSVADKCRMLNNFSTLTSIISALGTAPIHRLGRTWTAVNARTMATLENMRRLMGSTKNFAEYRDTLHKANPPCIPFFGVYLTDLTFIEDGIPSLIKKTNLINFAKRAKTAEVIRDIQQYQNVPYPLQPVPELQDYILTNMQSAGDVHEMYDMSLQVEPREREDEKIARLLSESGFL